MVDFSNVSLPFSVSDLVSSGNGLLGLVGAFVLLGMAFMFVPLLIEIINTSLGVYRDNKINAGSPKHQRKYSSAIYANVFEDRIHKFKR